MSGAAFDAELGIMGAAVDAPTLLVKMLPRPGAGKALKSGSYGADAVMLVWKSSKLIDGRKS